MLPAIFGRLSSSIGRHHADWDCCPVNPDCAAPQFTQASPVRSRNIHDPFTMPTADQLRAARALLRWTMEDLAARSGVSVRTIARCESAEGVPPVGARTLVRLVRAFQAAGIEFSHDADRSGVHLVRR
jgi:DNA-binding transcriptional regulator YiaG